MERRNRDYGDENNINLKLVIALARTLQMHRADTQKLLLGYGLTLSQFGVLEALYHLGELSVSEIIEKTLSTSGNMTVVIRNLERDGYIRRAVSKEDRRRYLIDLTEKGKQLIEKVFPVHLEVLGETFRGLSDDDKRKLYDLLSGLEGRKA